MQNDFHQKLSQTRRAQAELSLPVFAKLYLPHHVPLPLSTAHQELYPLLLDITIHRDKKVAIAAPRDFGKSTTITTIYVLYCLCFRRELFILLLSDTASQAIQTLENVKKELVHNQRLRDDFPELAEWEGQPKPPRWTQTEIETRTGIKVLALGSNQPIRGRKHGHVRPTLIIADDIETSGNTLSPELRDKRRSWFNQVVLKAGSQGTNYLFLGTLHHPHGLLAEYVPPNSRPEWIGKCYKAVVTWSNHPELWEQWARIYHGERYQDAFGPQAARKFYEAHETPMLEGTQVLWPEKWSYYKLMEIREEDDRSFSSEYQNEPLNPLECDFNPEVFPYWDSLYRSLEELLHALGEHLEFYGACDPSLGQDKLKGDYSAIIVLARDRRDGVLYVVVADIARRDPAQIIEDILAYAQRFRFQRFAIEANGFQKLLFWDLEQKSRERRLYLPIEEVTSTADKMKRIQSLYPCIKNKSLQFSKTHLLLLEQFRFFPKGKHDDGLDALEMAIRIVGRNPDSVDLVPIILDDLRAGEWDNVNWTVLCDGDDRWGYLYR